MGRGEDTGGGRREDLTIDEFLTLVEYVTKKLEQINTASDRLRRQLERFKRSAGTVGALTPERIFHQMMAEALTRPVTKSRRLVEEEEEEEELDEEFIERVERAKAKVLGRKAGEHGEKST